MGRLVPVDYDPFGDGEKNNQQKSFSAEELGLVEPVKPKDQRFADNGVLNDVLGTAYNVAQGATFDFTDEAIAGLGAAGSFLTSGGDTDIAGRRYDAIKDRLNYANKNFEEDSPWLSTGGKIAGAVGSAFLLPTSGLGFVGAAGLKGAQALGGAKMIEGVGSAVSKAPIVGKALTAGAKDGKGGFASLVGGAASDSALSAYGADEDILTSAALGGGFAGGLVGGDMLGKKIGKILTRGEHRVSKNLSDLISPEEFELMKKNVAETKADAQSLYDQGIGRNYSPTTGEASGLPLFQNLENFLRAEGNTDIVRNNQAFKDAMVGKMSQIPGDISPDVGALENTLNASKRSFDSQLENLGTHYGLSGELSDIITKSGKNIKDEARRLYNDPVLQQKVNVEGIDKDYLDVLRQQYKLVPENNRAIEQGYSKAKAFMDEREAQKQANKIARDETQNDFATVPFNDLSQARKNLRRELNNASDYTEQKRLSDTIANLTQRIDEIAVKNPEIGAKQAEADAFYHGTVDKTTKQQDIERILNKKVAPENVAGDIIKVSGDDSTRYKEVFDTFDRMINHPLNAKLKDEANRVLDKNMRYRLKQHLDEGKNGINKESIEKFRSKYGHIIEKKPEIGKFLDDMSSKLTDTNVKFREYINENGRLAKGVDEIAKDIGPDDLVKLKEMTKDNPEAFDAIKEAYLPQFMMKFVGVGDDMKKGTLQKFVDPGKSADTDVRKFKELYGEEGFKEMVQIARMVGRKGKTSGTGSQTFTHTQNKELYNKITGDGYDAEKAQRSISGTRIYGKDYVSANLLRSGMSALGAIVGKTIDKFSGEGQNVLMKAMMDPDVAIKLIGKQKNPKETELAFKKLVERIEKFDSTPDKAIHKEVLGMLGLKAAKGAQNMAEQYKKDKWKIQTGTVARYPSSSDDYISQENRRKREENKRFK